jgi:uncharacterized membrane protein
VSGGNQQLTIKSLLAQSWAAYQPALVPLWTATLAALIPLAVIAGLLPGLISLWPPMAVIVFSSFFLILVAANVIFVALPVYVFSCAQSQQGVSFQGFRSQISGRVGALMAAAFVFSALLLTAGYIGALFLIIPGLVIPMLLGCRWMVVYQVVLLQRQAPMSAFSRSSELTAGQRWKMFQLLLLIILVVLFLALLIGLLISAHQLPDRQWQLFLLSAGTIGLVAAVLPMLHLLPTAAYYQLLSAEDQGK